MSEVDETQLLEVATAAAHAAASVLHPRFGQQPRGVQAKSTPTDLVSEADLEAERAIRSVLAQRRPDDDVLGEEGGGDRVDAHGDVFTPVAVDGLRWVVDPLDGTINFLFGVPLFAVSVACEDAAGTVVGVVLDPMRDECFAATRSGEATLNGAAIKGSSRDQLATAMVATGFGYDAVIRARQASVLARVLPCVRDIRRCGAAALDLAWAASGRFDAYYERGLKVWDLAAGGLIATRAGLQTRELEAGPGDPAGVVVAPPGLIEELFDLVA